MDGSFNVAVAELDTVGVRAPDDNLSLAGGAAIADALRSSADDGNDALVWGPARVGRIDGSDSAEARHSALQRAAEINADILLYGIARPNSAGRATIELNLVVRRADERRPSDPLILEQAFGLIGDIDLRRFNTGSDALAALPILAHLQPVLEAVRLLDRDEPNEAIALLKRTCRGAATLTAGTQSSMRLLATIDALTGVGQSRLAEAGTAGALESALDSFGRSLALQPDLTVARLGQLGVRYLQIVGSSPATLDPSGAANSLDDLRALRAISVS